MSLTPVPQSASVPRFGNVIGENAYRVLRNGSYINGKNVIVDFFNDSNGKNNTIDTGSTTASFETDKFICGVNQLDLSSITSISGFSNGANAFDGDANTYASKSGDLNYNTMTIYATMTIPQGSVDLKRIRCKAYQQAVKGNTSAMSAYLQVYRAGAWETAFTIGSVTGTGSKSFTGDVDQLVNLTGVTQVRVYYSGPSIDTYSLRLYELELYAGYTDTEVISNQNTKTLDGSESKFCLFADVVTPTNTSVTYDISDGTSSITDQTLGETIDISTLGAGTCEIRLNLNTTDDSVTPEAYGFAGVFVED